jgi:hypothetical protein
MDIGKGVHDEGARGDDLAVDVRLRAHVAPHRRVGLCYAERFTDEHVHDWRLAFPRGQGDGGERGGGRPRATVIARGDVRRDQVRDFRAGFITPFRITTKICDQPRSYRG